MALKIISLVSIKHILSGSSCVFPSSWWQSCCPTPQFRSPCPPCLQPPSATPHCSSDWITTCQDSLVQVFLMIAVFVAVGHCARTSVKMRVEARGKSFGVILKTWPPPSWNLQVKASWLVSKAPGSSHLCHDYSYTLQYLTSFTLFLNQS